MTIHDISPKSITSRIVLPSTGTISNVIPNLAFNVYSSSEAFLSGAVEQVAYTYKQLAGDIVDIELTEGSVYSSYEKAVHEYSYLIDIYQAKNVLGSVMGTQTASFNHNGEISDGSDETLNTKLPKYEFGYARRLWKTISAEAHAGGYQTLYSASFIPETGKQLYDLQEIFESDPNVSGTIGNKKILVKKVYYKAPRSTWRFYGYYGGLNVVGNMSTYGQYADDSVFDIVPVSQNKLQAMAFKDSLFVRTSHYSFELFDNKLRLYPPPSFMGPRKIWVEFVLPGDVWGENDDDDNGVDGVNNLNNVPFSYVPFDSINYIGKWWIRKYALYDSMLILAQSRGKWDRIPIPGNEVTLNASQLESTAKEGMEKMREELKEMLEQTSYDKLLEQEKNMQDNSKDILKNVPLGVWIG